MPVSTSLIVPKVLEYLRDKRRTRSDPHEKAGIEEAIQLLETGEFGPAIIELEHSREIERSRLRSCESRIDAVNAKPGKMSHEKDDEVFAEMGAQRAMGNVIDIELWLSILRE